MPIFDEIKDDVSNTNFKVIAGAPANGSSQMQYLASIDAVNNQRIVNAITNFSLMEALGQRAGADVSEAVATGRVMASSSADLMAQLGAVVAALQQIVKMAQTTNPVTP